ncbi:hypothetical protein DNHGIG_40470 [Collibacillus ludicampi]|uniref:Uncharacterized protein n=1 Tax=Collibacillus ludicampi TaxID=2771369 RepID=A0AAV4LL60_9BACL|nr:hypothetical protein [Collibacillus ludicampi]GIM48498.1 hypothetical protein DNHGIG_40470 [Collibacillus ludicampi]
MTERIKLTRQEYEEYKESYEKLQAAKSLVEVRAWAKKCRSILEKAQERQRQEAMKEVQKGLDELSAASI